MLLRIMKNLRPFAPQILFDDCPLRVLVKSSGTKTPHSQIYNPNDRTYRGNEFSVFTPFKAFMKPGWLYQTILPFVLQEAISGRLLLRCIGIILEGGFQYLPFFVPGPNSNFRGNAPYQAVRFQCKRFN